MAIYPNWSTYQAIAARALLEVAIMSTDSESIKTFTDEANYRLRRAAELEPLSVHWVLQAARGEVLSGQLRGEGASLGYICALYERALTMDPSRISIYSEAGDVGCSISSRQ